MQKRQQNPHCNAMPPLTFIQDPASSKDIDGTIEFSLETVDVMLWSLPQWLPLKAKLKPIHSREVPRSTSSITYISEKGKTSQNLERMRCKCTKCKGELRCHGKEKKKKRFSFTCTFFPSTKQTKPISRIQGGR